MPGSATAASGVATKTVTGVLAGSVTVTAHSGSLTDDTTTFTVVAGALRRSSWWQTRPGDVPSGSPRDVTAEVQDAAGNLVTSDNSTSVSFTQTSGSGSVTGGGSATASSGVATKTLTGDAAGSGHRDCAQRQPDRRHLDVHRRRGCAFEARDHELDGNLASGSTRVVTAEVQDAAGNVVTGDNSTSVSFTQTSGSGSVSGTGSSTAASGVATKTVTGDAVGSVTVTAHSGSLTDDTSTFAVVAGGPAKLVITSSAANLRAGSTRDITAEVQDASGNVVTGDNSTSVSFTQTSGSGSVTGAGSATASNGVATKTVTGVLAGSVTVTAHSGSLTDDTTTFTIVAGAAAKLVITSSSGNLASGSTRDVTAEVQDAAGNVVTGDNSTSVSFTQTSGSGSITGGGSATASNGVADIDTHRRCGRLGHRDRAQRQPHRRHLYVHHRRGRPGEARDHELVGEPRERLDA